MDLCGLGTAEEFQSVLETIAENGEQGLSKLKAMLNTPEYERTHRTYRLNEMLALTNLPRSTWRKYVSEERITLPGYFKDEDGKPELLKKKEFTLGEIQKIRIQTGRGFWNGKVNPPKARHAIALAVSMFKGGVGKTTQATHLAAKAAILGIKTLFIDCDYQASGTLALGFVPGFDIDEDKNIYHALLKDPQYITDSIVRTHIENLYMVPASLALSGANVELLNPQINQMQNLGNPLTRLKHAIERVRDDFDLIILDCPPNFEAVSMNALVASDGFMLPITPSMLSLSSAVSFCQTVSDLYNSIIRANQASGLQNKLFRVLLTNDPQNAESERIVSVIRSLFGPYLMKHAMPRTIALDRASNDLSILYDIRRTEVRGDRKAFDRAINSMDLINEEILTSLKPIWGVD